MSNTRIPMQKRSVEKRNRIIEKGFELMCEKGFYNTNTVEIAEYACVSTGIIYQYFNDKKDIFIEGVKNYSNSIMKSMLDIIDKKKISTNNLENLFSLVIDKYVESHTISKRAHEELIAMGHLDKDVGNIFRNLEINVTNYIVDMLNNSNIVLDNVKEKVHIIIGIIDILSHETVYLKHNEIDYDVMKREVIKIIITIIKE